METVQQVIVFCLNHISYGKHFSKDYKWLNKLSYGNIFTEISILSQGFL